MDGRSWIIEKYLFMCQYAYLVAKADWFNNTILGVIMLAGVNVGISTYFDPGEEPAWLDNMDLCIFWMFWSELLVKVMATGVSPWNFLIGQEWRWNVFDLFIMVMSSLAMVGLGIGDVTILRLIRLMRLAKVFRKIPQLQMIITGLIGGLQSIFYIFILMALTFYLYAVVAIIYLSPNDPWHFGSVEMSMITLFRLATLDNWGDMMFISYEGCGLYQWDVYTTDPDDEAATEEVGAVIYCTPEMHEQRAHKGIVILFFVSFIILASFCMLSLFVGAVSMSMAESMEKMNEEKAGKRKHKHRAMIELKIMEMTVEQDQMTRENKHKVDLIEQAFTGQHMHLQISSHKIDWNDLITVYKFVSDMTQLFVMSNLFTNFVTFVIIIAGVLVGLETYSPGPEIRVWMTLADEVVFWVFMLEMVLKIIAEEFYPINPWISSVAVSPAGTGWNIFDGIVVLGSAGTKWSSGTGDSQSLVMMLRLLKLLRVLKLMRALPQLQVIVEALGKGMSSIGFVGLILCIFFYFSGILAMLLFKDNDPWHFGSLHMTVISLFQCATLDDWTPILYINMFGCETNGYDDFDELGPQHCDPEIGGGQPWIAALFFVWFILVGGLVLLTLFIGVVSMGMDEAEMEQKEQKKVEERVWKITTAEGLEQLEVTLYREVFECVDFTHSNKIGKDELRFGMTIANMTLTDDEFDTIFSKVDKDKSEAIDFAEFLEFMFDLKDQLNHWPEERKKNIGVKKRRKKEAFNFLGGKHGGSKVVPVGGAEGGHDSDEMSDISGMLDAQPEMTHTLTTHTPTLPAYREDDGPYVDVDHPDMYVMKSESCEQGGSDSSALEMVSNISPSYDSREDELQQRPRKSQRSQRRASRDAAGGMVAVSPEEHASHTRETAQHKHQIMELQGQIQQLHSLLSSQRGGGVPGTPSNNNGSGMQMAHMGDMGSPMSQNLVPSAVVVQQSQGMAQMQQVIAQQADQMKIMMEMHNTHINTTTALLAERAQTAALPDSYYGDGWAGRPGSTGPPGTAPGQTSPLMGAGMNVMGRSSAGGGSAFAQGGFGSSGGRQLETDGRSPPSAAQDSLSVMMQSPSPSRMPNKTYTPSTDGSRPSPSKKPTKSTVVCI